MAKKPNATREFKTPASQRRKSSSSRSSAYRTARIARERQKREIEQQKREKMMFALFVVVILVMLLFAILVFKKALGNDEQTGDITNPDEINSTVDDTNEDENTPPYSTTISVAKSAVNSGSLILVNAQNGYIASQSSLKNAGESRTAVGTDASGKTVYSYYLASKDSTLLNEDALVAFNSMADDFYKATKSVDLFIGKAYASGTDEYATGLALDLSIWTGGNNYYPLNDPDFADAFDWIFENYYKYGFVISNDANNSFCFRYVGIPHAYYMHKHDLTLEKYLELVRRETLAYTDNNGDKYEVYYVHATGDVINVPLYSADAEYSISGDNSEGLIVSVKVN